VSSGVMLAGLHGVFKQLRRNGHRLMKGGCEQLSTAMLVEL
jgi:hypothetical protein